MPALFNAINNFPGVENLDMTSVKSCFSGRRPSPATCRSASRPHEVHDHRGLRHERDLAGDPREPLYGMRKIGSIGIPVSNTDAKIVDAEDDTKELGVGEEGELLVRGPQVMQGYWNREEESAETLKGGWMHTGDLASMDEDGYFRICGRKKDMINCSGLKVFPDEVDEVLMAHPAILEAATIGVPDPERGETVKSFIVLNEGASLTEEEVESYAREQLAAYKIPRKVQFMDELPKSSVMKILRRELRDMEEGQQGGCEPPGEEPDSRGACPSSGAAPRFAPFRAGRGRRARRRGGAAALRCTRPRRPSGRPCAWRGPSRPALPAATNGPTRCSRSTGSARPRRPGRSLLRPAPSGSEDPAEARGQVEPALDELTVEGRGIVQRSLVVRIERDRVLGRIEAYS